MVLRYRSCHSETKEWKSIQQRVPISLTACHFERPWLPVRFIVTAAIAGAELPSFTALANYSPVGGASQPVYDGAGGLVGYAGRPVQVCPGYAGPR